MITPMNAVVSGFNTLMVGGPVDAYTTSRHKNSGRSRSTLSIFSTSWKVKIRDAGDGMESTTLTPIIPPSSRTKIGRTGSQPRPLGYRGAFNSSQGSQMGNVTLPSTCGPKRKSSTNVSA